MQQGPQICKYRDIPFQWPHRDNFFRHQCIRTIKQGLGHLESPKEHIQ